jgi:flavodoxin short chain
MNAKGASASVLSVDQVSENVANEYERFAFGCPSMGVEVLEEDEFEPFFTQIERNLKDRKVALFGSYGWGDGEWMQDWQTRTKAAGAVVFEEGLIQLEEPDEEVCRSFGERFAEF